MSKTSNGSSIVLINTVDGLSKDTNRVRNVYTVTDKNDSEETIPLYSTAEKVD